jgi:small-conductance mechanosensitive channel
MKLKVMHMFLFCAMFNIFLLPVMAQEASTTGEPVTAVATESTTAANSISDDDRDNRRFLSKWIHMIDSEGGNNTANSSVIAYAMQAPADLARVLISTGGDRGIVGFLGVLLRSIAAIGFGFLFVLAAKLLFKDHIDKLRQLTPPNEDKLSLFWVNAIRQIPPITALVLLAVFSILFFLLLAGSMRIEGRMVFQSILGIVLIFSICSMIGKVIFAPEDTSRSLIDIDTQLVKPVYSAFFASSSALLSGLLVVNLVRELGALPQTIAWIIILLGTTIIAFNAYLIFNLRKPISHALQSTDREQSGNWIKDQLTAYWHVPALIYLFIIWFIWIGQMMTGTSTQNGSFIISMLIVPIYFALSHAGQLLVISLVDSLELGKPIESDNDINLEEDEKENLANRQKIAAKAYIIFRILLVTALTAWVLALWGYSIPYASQAIKAIFQSLITLSLALMCWRFASAFIQKKMEEATPEAAKEEGDVNDEFGGAAPRGRNHTLLPMLRKVLGTILVVMAILIVLSSLGVNIGPLLAGAGVLGLAVGFGAQKLVSDILSGFFFLLDDAFRVGEYIQTGSIRGTVETITLRNVMLRHHLGMLQIVPHSDLGAVTNYMRGGIVIKFPLEFPYDTDIDKVRKIIKKVGIAMLADEEIGEDFLQPLKSQGVNQITNSVMVIRVKFTAKPGKQFVIKREAFRRITESLNAKGIYYAHRKVIVDFPTDNQGSSTDEQTRNKALQAGAAAVIAAEAEEQKESQ